MSQITDELTADLGGDPTTAERLLISNVRVKAARLYLLEQQLLDGDGEDTGADIDPKHVLAWSNSLRCDLVALGLKRRMRELPSAGNASRIEAHFARPYQPAAE